MHRRIQTAGLLGVLLLVTGCTQIYDAVDQHLIDFHDKIDAKAAWHECSDWWSDEPYVRDFRYGFKDGYYDAMQGGGKCPPTIPPRKYWSVHNRGADSAARVVAWYDGYVMGSTQAMADGNADKGQIVTASQIYHTSQPEVAWPTEGETGMEPEPMHEPQLLPPPIPEPGKPSAGDSAPMPQASLDGALEF